MVKQGHEIIDKAVRYRCPKCQGRNFTFSQIAVYLWICENCGFQGMDVAFKDNTPDGCFLADNEKELANFLK